MRKGVIPNKRYVQLLFAEKTLINDMGAGRYKSKFAVNFCKLIKEETKLYQCGVIQ